MKEVYNTVVIDISIDPDSWDQFSFLKDSPVLKAAKRIILLNIYNKKMKVFLPGSVDNCEDLEEVTRSIPTILDKVKQQIIPAEKRYICETKCILDPAEKISAIDFLKDQQADLVVASLRKEEGEAGLFGDTFTYHLIEFAPCDIYIVRKNSKV